MYSKTAIWAFVLSLLPIVLVLFAVLSRNVIFLGFTMFGGVFSLAGLILAIFALVKTNSVSRLSGRGLSISAIILSVLEGVLVFVIYNFVHAVWT